LTIIGLVVGMYAAICSFDTYGDIQDLSHDLETLGTAVEEVEATVEAAITEAFVTLEQVSTKIAATHEPSQAPTLQALCPSNNLAIAGLLC